MQLFNRPNYFNKKCKSQQGFFLVFTALSLLALILVMALAMEIGRLMITARNLQIAADAAALAGVQRLRKCDPTNPLTTPYSFDCSFYGGTSTQGIGGWVAVKPAVITALQSLRLNNEYVDNLVFNAIPTRGDILDTLDGFGDLRFEQGTTTSNNLTVRVERLFECDNSGVITLVSLEKSAYDPAPNLYHYCLANTVRLTLTYTGHYTIFGELLGHVGNRTITKQAVARTRRTTVGAGMCDFPSCSLTTTAVQQCYPGQ